MFRCYALIASTKPLFVLFHHGYLRLTVEDYDLSNFFLSIFNFTFFLKN